MKLIPIVLALLCSSVIAAAAAPSVRVGRVPEQGIQPEAAVDAKGVAHLIYLTGDPQACDVRYATTASVKDFSFGEPTPVNRHAGSAIATGTIRGPHLSVDANGRPHVAWMGSSKSAPKAPGKYNPMLYTRLGDDGRFETERNLATKFVGLDGGGTVAAGPSGTVYVAWHAPSVIQGDEATRRVFVARSRDGGKTFEPERPVDVEGLGACACCGMALLASRDDGAIVGLFRTARQQVHRDTRAFVLGHALAVKWNATLDAAESSTCVMSTFALADNPGTHRFAAAWETLGKIRVGFYSYQGGVCDPAHDVPGADKQAKHPTIAINREGELLVAWAKDTGWERGGSIGWQVFDAQLHPVAGASGRDDGLPVWSKPAAFADRDGNFVVLY